MALRTNQLHHAIQQLRDASLDAIFKLTAASEYRDIEKSIQIISQERGRHFDPDVVDAFFSVQDAILRIEKTYEDDRESLLFKMNAIRSH